MIVNEMISCMEQYNKYLNERFIFIDELNHILQIMKTCKSYRILITGSAGSGKTTLLHQLANYVGKNTPVEFVSALEIQYKGFLEKSPLAIRGQIERLLLVDGLDEIQNPFQVLQQLEVQNCKQLICTSRFNISNDNYFTHTVEIKPLTLVQIDSLIKRFGVDSNVLLPLINSFVAANLTPRDIISMLLSYIDEANLYEFYARNSYFLYQLGNGIDFSSEIILPKKELIVPSKEITTSITIVNDTLLQQARQNPNIMYSFTPREFEQMICELFEKQGYNVKLTKQTRDGGKDIIIIEKTPIGEFCIYVGCKKYNANRPISVKLVRELYGIVDSEKATAGMLITTSYFTKDAKEFTEKNKHRMTLRDYNDLVQELNEFNF